MTDYPLTWLADVLRAGGCRVVEESGWKTRGRPSSSGSFHPKALLRHWDASGPGSHGAISTVLNGTSSTPGPLCSILTCRGNSAHAASVHVIAAGRANHGGEGDAWGVIPANGANTYAVGHEIAQTVDQPWPADQLDQVRKAEAAILKRLGAKTSNALCAHSEYAAGRKIDTTEGRYGQDMNAERRAVQAIIDGEPTEDDVRVSYCKVSNGDGMDSVGSLVVWEDESTDSEAMHGAGMARISALYPCVISGVWQVHCGTGVSGLAVQRHGASSTDYKERIAYAEGSREYVNVPFTAKFSEDEGLYCKVSQVGNEAAKVGAMVLFVTETERT